MATNAARSSPPEGHALHGRKPGDDDCWSHIGVSGDRTCPELSSVIHCRNCPVFTTAARTFFDRPAPEGYLADWSHWLAKSIGRDGSDEGGGENENEAQSHEEKVSVLDLPAWTGMAGLPHPDRCRGHDAPACPQGSPSDQRGFPGIGEPARSSSALCLASRLAGCDGRVEPGAAGRAARSQTGRDLGFRGR